MGDPAELVLVEGDTVTAAVINRLRLHDNPSFGDADANLEALETFPAWPRQGSLNGTRFRVRS